ncbi:sulfonate ABC transporter ATP-binding protein, partial [Kitasatospora sp. NPDC059571]
ALPGVRMQARVGRVRGVHRPAVLLVTHDVDEAIRLADRVAVLRDGRLVTDERVALAGPRDGSHPAFAALRTRLLADLGVRATDPTDPTDPVLPTGPSTPERSA